MSLNKHGDYQEVIFSSALSYLLNPKNDHNLGNDFLVEFIKDLNIENFNVQRIPDMVTSEVRLGDQGSIDIEIDYKNLLIGIEVKIWDRSGKNISKNNVTQLNRYCKYFDSKNKNWKLIYLVPNESSKICIDSYNKLEEHLKKNVRLMAWSYSTTDLPDFFLERSVMDIINDFYKSRKRSNINPQASWIIDSLFEFIPNLISQIKDTTKFPSKSDLQKLEKTWPIFESFFEYFSVWPNPVHTAIGIPYGKGDNQVNLHKNSLFRIRTTKDYYSLKSDMERFLPYDFIELELWNDVFHNIEVQLRSWMKENNISEDFLSDGLHLDERKDINIKVLKIDKVLTNEALEKLDEIIRYGFKVQLDV